MKSTTIFEFLKKLLLWNTKEGLTNLYYVETQFIFNNNKFLS